MCDFEIEVNRPLLSHSCIVCCIDLCTFTILSVNRQAICALDGVTPVVELHLAVLATLLTCVTI